MTWNFLWVLPKITNCHFLVESTPKCKTWKFLFILGEAGFRPYLPINMEFDVCFYRWQQSFEVSSKTRSLK
jgi:hypothetical protein